MIIKQKQEAAQLIYSLLEQTEKLVGRYDLGVIYATDHPVCDSICFPDGSGGGWSVNLKKSSHVDELLESAPQILKGLSEILAKKANTENELRKTAERILSVFI